MSKYPVGLKGKFLEYKLDSGGSRTRDEPIGGVLRGEETPIASVKIWSKSEPDGAWQAETPWNFKFLNYVPFYTTIAKLDSGTMTGPMSGCFLFKFREDYQSYFGHVGTVDQKPLKNKEVKEAWGDYVASNNITDVMGGQPCDDHRIGASTNEAIFDYDDFKNASELEGIVPSVYSYFESNRPAYALLLCQIRAPLPPGAQHLAKVVEVKNYPLAFWSRIQNSTRWKK